MCPNAICLSVGLPTSHSLIPFKNLMKRDSDLRSFLFLGPCEHLSSTDFRYWAEEINYLEHSCNSCLNFSTPNTCQIIIAPNLKGRGKSQVAPTKQKSNRKKPRSLSHPPKVIKARGQQSSAPLCSTPELCSFQLYLKTDEREPQTLGG